MVKVRIEGGAQLAKALQSLPDRVSTRVLRSALIEAAEPMRDRMIALAPREPGKPDIADDILIQPVTRFRDDSDSVGDLVRVEEGSAAVVIGPTKPFFYGKFLEYGTARMAPRPFMRPAFDTEGIKALQRVTASIWRALTKAGAGSSSSPSGTGNL